MIKVKWYQQIRNETPNIDWINLGNGTVFRVIHFFITDPKPGFFVGLERVGCFIFDLKTKKSSDYVCEKLNLRFSDSANMADWINAQLGFETHFGSYEEHLIKENEPYGNLDPNVPIVFETMIFEGDESLDYQERYSTWKEAEEGHKRAVEWVKNGCKDLENE